MARDMHLESQQNATHAQPPPHLRVAVHDRARVEWVTTVPIAPPDQSQAYEVVFEAQVPDAIWVAHQPWERFQVRSRLTSPMLTPGTRQVGPAIDQLRRRALSAVHALKLASRPPLQLIHAARKRDGQLRDDEAQSILSFFSTSLANAGAAREAFDYLRDANDQALEREQKLADEYVSAHILLLITRVANALEGRPAVKGAATRAGPMLGEVGQVQLVLREALLREQQHRKDAGIRHAGLHGISDVEAFLNRGALLKKHFQQALFLDAKAYMLDQRLRNWIAAAVAMIASIFYFVGQIYMFNGLMTAGATTVSLVLAGLIAALVYAAKDRIKEVGRVWVMERLKHWYADRVAHLTLQERMDPKCSKFALARETIDIRRTVEPDRLNPGLGRTTVVHHLRVHELLRHSGLQLLHDSGLLGLKHIFRYDLSPLLAKLDDHLKRVPVVSADGVQTRAATRVYTIPLSVRLQQVGSDAPAAQLRGHLLMRRSGLVRFVPSDNRQLQRLHLPQIVPVDDEMGLLTRAG